MKPGIRLQLLIALAGLMVLAFVPLFFAMASLTRSTLQSVRDSSARTLGRAVASHVAEARTLRDPQHIESLLHAEIGSGAVAAIGVYSEAGELHQRAGEPSVAAVLEPRVPLDTERIRTLRGPQARWLEVLVPHKLGPVVVLLDTDDESAQAGPLLRLLAMYTVIFALALLVFAYMALTRMIVRPIDQLSASAHRVAQGARNLEAPATGARELAELGGALSDMTRRLRDEEAALRNKIRELETRTEELKSAQRAIIRSERLASVGRLSAGLAHEIGNPIAALLGLEELLLSGDLDPHEQRDFLRRMKSETERIHNVLRQLLDFARPATSLAGAQPEEPGSLAEAIETAQALLRPQKTFRDIELHVDVSRSLPLVALSTNKMVQVVLNLMLNACDATQGAGTIEVRAHARQEGVRLEVRDNGPGIAAEIRDNLFEPFVTTKEVGQGTGLGLAVCRGLVESVGGSVMAENAADGGAVFVVELPAAEAEQVREGVGVEA